MKKGARDVFVIQSSFILLSWPMEKIKIHTQGITYSVKYGIENSEHTVDKRKFFNITQIIR